MLSFVEIYAFGKDGNAFLYDKVANPDSGRGALAIWKYFEKKYLPVYRPEGTPSNISDDDLPAFLGYEPSRFNANTNAQHEVWDLVDNPSVPIMERIVLNTTLNECLVKKEDIPKVIEAFTAFDGETNLLQQALVLENILLSSEDILAVGWSQDSIFPENWLNYPYEDLSEPDAKDQLIEDCDETMARGVYNCRLYNRHYWLFDSLVPTPAN